MSNKSEKKSDKSYWRSESISLPISPDKELLETECDFDTDLCISPVTTKRPETSVSAATAHIVPPSNELKVEELQDRGLVCGLLTSTSQPSLESSIKWQQLELRRLKLELHTIKSQRDSLVSQLNSSEREQSSSDAVSVCREKMEFNHESDYEKQTIFNRKEEAGRKLIRWLIQCQSPNGLGPPKDVLKAKLKKVVHLLSTTEHVDLTFTDSFGSSSLHLLCAIHPSKISLAAIRKLLEKGHDLESRTQYGKTCVHICAETPNAYALRLLVRCRADVTTRSKSSISPSALEIAMSGLRYSSAEARANSYMYAEIVTSLTYRSIMKGVLMTPEVVEEYGSDQSINQAVQLGRERACRAAKITRAHLAHRLKVEVLVDVVISYVGISLTFHPLPAFPRNAKRSLKSKRLCRSHTMPKVSKS